MKASAGRRAVNTSLHNFAQIKPPQLKRVPQVGAELEVSLSKLSVTRTFKRVYMVVCLAVLLLTTLLWSLLGARLANNNADQLSDSYLFESLHTFREAQFPGQHTFLLKWPLFWIQNVFGTNVTSFEILTVLLCLVTVGGMALLLQRIERRPVVAGTLYLALAGVLLLVPAVPSPGTLLPTNMAMLTTRNIEYLVYIGALIMCIRARRLLSWPMLGAAALFVCLFVSDRLFASLSIGGAVLMLGFYAVTRRPYLRGIGLRWLSANVIGVVGMAGGLALLRHLRVTDFADSSGTSPYALAQGLHDVGLGIVYAFLGTLTNFGANPGHGVLTLREVPGAFRGELISPAVIAYGLNLLVFAAAVFAAAHVIRLSMIKVKVGKYSKKPPVNIESIALGLAIALLASCGAAVAAYALTHHYYVVDSRYLTLTMISLFVCLAVYTRGRTLKASYVLMTAAVLFIGCLSGIYFALHSYQAERNGLQSVQARNATIAQVLQSHRESTLVGDYWRVFPIKLEARKQLAILPLTSCTTPRPDLSSRTWQVDLHKRSFAYLLTLDSRGPNFPACTLRAVTTVYGQPNAITVIAGTTDKPREVLLFYDHGEASDTQRGQTDSVEGPAESALTPVPVDSLLNVDCPTGDTVMQIVAHEDDDLLFMNPDLEHSIDAGDCIRTVYVTAGDAGGGKFYWLGREQGSEAAYAKLAQVPNIWLEQTVRIAPQEFATIASPSRDPRLTLVFLHLPDGNINGQGFARSTDEGLAKLEAGNIRSIRSVDSQSEYTYPQLQSALRNLISAYSPEEMRTQLPQNASETYADHSDHLAVGRLATAAFRMYTLSHPYAALTYYMGYPVHDQPQNVSGTDLDRKEQAFLTYSHYDGGTCQNAEQCSTGVYNIYLQRQYSQPAQP